MGRIRRAALVIVLLVPLLAAASNSAHAATSCVGSGLYSGGDGKYTNPSGGDNFFHAARADISTPAAPDLCSEITGAFSQYSNVWVMLQGDPGEGSQEYAQIGYEFSYYAGPVKYYFTEWDNDYSSPVDMYPSTYPAHGSTHKYTVHRNSDGYYDLAIDGNVEETTSFKPEASWETNQAQFAEESSNPGDDIFGTSGEENDFSSTDLETQSGDWVNPNYQGNLVHPCYYNTNVITLGVEFNIWTSPLSHSC